MVQGLDWQPDNPTGNSNARMASRRGWIFSMALIQLSLLELGSRWQSGDSAIEVVTSESCPGILVVFVVPKTVVLFPLWGTKLCRASGVPLPRQIAHSASQWELANRSEQ